MSRVILVIKQDITDINSHTFFRRIYSPTTLIFKTVIKTKSDSQKHKFAESLLDPIPDNTNHIKQYLSLNYLYNMETL